MTKPIACFCILALMLKFAHAENVFPSETPTSTQVAKLIAEAWRPAPKNTEVTCMVSFMLPPRNEAAQREVLRQAYTELFTGMDAATSVQDTKSSLDRELRVTPRHIAQQVEEQLARNEEAARHPRVMRILSRRSGLQQRWDFAINWHIDDHVMDDTPYQFGEANLIDPSTGRRTFKHVAHKAKTAYLKHEVNGKIDPTWEYGEMTLLVRAMLRFMTMVEPPADANVVPSPELVIFSPEKSRSLEMGEHAKLRLTVRDVVLDGMPCHEWAIWSRETKINCPLFVVACRSDDYSVVPKVIYYNPKLQNWYRKIEAFGFRMEGGVTFPEVVRDESLLKLTTGEHFLHAKDFVIQSKSHPDSFPVEVFGFQAPEGYKLRDYRSLPTVASTVVSPASRMPSKLQFTALVIVGLAVPLLFFKLPLWCYRGLKSKNTLRSQGAPQ